jgi:hypothetical protein
LLIWTIVAVGWAIFVFGGHVQMCLGPLDVTPESCRVALGLPPETNWDRFANGPGLLVAVVVVGWLVILLASRWRGRQRGGL